MTRRDALHWLPSQAYYAIHAALDAALEAHGLATESHQAALNSFGGAIARQLPSFPLAAACEGYPARGSSMASAHLPTQRLA